MIKVPKVIMKNLPIILTVGSAVLSAAAVGVAVYEGAKLKEDMDSWDEETTTFEKVKTVTKRSLPFISLEAASIVCGIGSYKKQAAKIAALATGIAATQADKDKLQKQIDILKDPNKSKEEKEREIESYNPGDKNAFDTVWFHDTVTGYTYKSTLADFWEEVGEFNDILESGNEPISTFYDSLLGRQYQHAKGYDDYVFGPSMGAKQFNPKLKASMAKDMTLMYDVSYRYNGFDYNDLM